jgi:hypothetical protein
MSTAVHPCWDRWSWDWGHFHFARRIDRTLTPDELAAGLVQLLGGPDEPPIVSAERLKALTDEQERMDAEYRERAT